MTKKDYIMLAKVLRNNQPFQENGDKKEGDDLFQSILNDLSSELSKDNPRFDAYKFSKALNG